MYWLQILQIRENRMPSEWEDTFIFSVFKGKSEDIDRGNYRGLKLKVVLKVVERIINVIIRDVVNVDDMQFGFMLERGTTDAILIFRKNTSERIVIFTLHLLT